MRVRNKRLQSYSVGGNSFKVDLDGYGQRDVLAGKGPDKRREFFYWTDDGDLAGLRYYWRSSWSSPLELAEHEAGAYEKWLIEHLFVLVPQAIVARRLGTFQEFPPRQKPDSFSIGEAMDMLMKQKSSN